MNCMIVDDSKLFREALKKILNELGFKKTVEAADGMDALKKLRTESISLVFLDWEMPKLNGMQVLHAIRANETLHDLPVFMVTGHTRKDEIVSAMKAGVSGYIVKPYEKETVKTKLKDTGFLK